MRVVVFSAKARYDLQEIADHIAFHDRATAVRFVAELRDRCRSLAAHPFQGRSAPDIAPEVRLLVFSSYVIFHRIDDNRVLIDRVIHRARDRSAIEPYE